MTQSIPFLLPQLLLCPLLYKHAIEWGSFVGKPIPIPLSTAIYFALGIGFYLLLPNALPVNELVAVGVLVSLLISLSIIDAHTQYIPNIFPMGIAVMGFGVNVAEQGPFTHPCESFIAGVASYGLLAGANLLYKRMKGVDGIGMGDAKLFAALGFWFGWAGMLPILIISNALFIAVSLVRGFWGKGDAPLAFGPYLAVAGGVMVWSAISSCTAIRFLILEPLLLAQCF